MNEQCVSYGIIHMHGKRRTNEKLKIEAEIATAQHAHFTYRHFLLFSFHTSQTRIIIIIIIIENYSSLILLFVCICVSVFFLQKRFKAILHCGISDNYAIYSAKNTDPNQNGFKG